MHDLKLKLFGRCGGSVLLFSLSNAITSYGDRYPEGRTEESNSRSGTIKRRRRRAAFGGEGLRRRGCATVHPVSRLHMPPVRRRDKKFSPRTQARPHRHEASPDKWAPVAGTAGNAIIRRSSKYASPSSRSSPTAAGLNKSESRSPSALVNERRSPSALRLPSTPHSRDLRHNMELLGLTEEEQGRLWVDGVDSKAWLDALREDDFAAAGVHIATRRRARDATRAFEDARDEKDQAQHRTVQATHEVLADGAAGITDSESPLGTAARDLEASKRRLRDAETEQDLARRAADDSLAELQSSLTKEDTRAQHSKDELRRWVRAGAAEFHHVSELNSGRLSEQGVEAVLAAVVSLEQLCAMDLGAMRRLGLTIPDRRLLKSMTESYVPDALASETRQARELQEKDAYRTLPS